MEGGSESRGLGGCSHGGPDYFRPMPVVSSSRPMLATRLVTAAACGRADAYYRLARIVARVLVSVRLRQREKWRSLARQLAADPGVEDRLVLQAIGWLRRGQPTLVATP